MLTPTGGVTDNGLIIAREADAGRYVLDSGVAFDVESASLTALDAGVAACADPANTLVVTVIEPFGNGSRVTVQVSR